MSLCMHHVQSLVDCQPSTSYTLPRTSASLTKRLTRSSAHNSATNKYQQLQYRVSRLQASKQASQGLPDSILQEIQALIQEEQQGQDLGDDQQRQGGARSAGRDQVQKNVGGRRKKSTPTAQRQPRQSRVVSGQDMLVDSKQKPGQRQSRQGSTPNSSAADGAIQSAAALSNHRCGYVALIGKPNAGKSTLLNALLRQKVSIVTRKAQTTRHRILGILSDEDSQVMLMDTPGVIEAIHNKLDVKMMEAVRQAVQDADGVLVVVDSAEEHGAVLPIMQAAPATGPSIAVVLNKVDLIDTAKLQELRDVFLTCSPAVKAVFACSALNDKGVEAVRNWVSHAVPPGPALYDKEIVAEQPERFFVAEIMREQIFLQYQQEIPYSISVLCTDYKERAKGKDYVEVEIYVERAQQRGIVLGREGSALKKLNTAARAEIEAFLGRPVYLEVSVKVKEKWRADDQVLQQFGY